MDSGIERSKSDKSDNVSDGLSDGPKPISISKVVLENQDDDDVPAGVIILLLSFHATFF